MNNSTLFASVSLSEFFYGKCGMNHKLIKKMN